MAVAVPPPRATSREIIEDLCVEIRGLTAVLASAYQGRLNRDDLTSWPAAQLVDQWFEAGIRVMVERIDENTMEIERLAREEALTPNLTP